MLFIIILCSYNIRHAEKRRQAQAARRQVAKEKISQSGARSIFEGGQSSQPKYLKIDKSASLAGLKEMFNCNEEEAQRALK
jgi:hypothetical protein